MNRKDAKLTGATRYHGRICWKHPELNGERTVRDYKCVGCKKEEKQATNSDDPRFQELKEIQGSRCPICGGHLSAGKKTVADRDSSGAIVGLLCKRCGLGLSCLDRDVERLRAAIWYIERGV